MADVKVKVNQNNLTNVRVGQGNAIKVVSSISGTPASSSDFSLKSGISTNVIGGIASVTSLNVSGLSTFVGVATFKSDLYVDGHLYVNQDIEFDEVSGRNLNISGISTLGTLQVSSGVVTATSGVITYYGDGSNLTNTGAALSVPSTGSRRLVLTSLTSGTMVSAATTSDIVYDFENKVFTVSGITTTTELSVGENITASGGIITATTFDGNVTGNVTGSADTLTTERDFSISGDVITQTIPFNGSANVGFAVTLASDFSANTTGIVTASKLSTGTVGTGINVGTSSITGPSDLIIDPSGVGDDTGKVTIKGDLFVLGTETKISSQTIELADHRVGIATTVGTNLLLNGGGIGIGSANILKTFTYHNTSDTLRSSVGLGVTSGQVFKIGSNTVLNSTTLGSGITLSSLTKLGTLSNLNISGLSTFTGIATFSTNVNIGGTLTALDIDGGEY